MAASSNRVSRVSLAYICLFALAFPYWLALNMCFPVALVPTSCCSRELFNCLTVSLIR